jgi:acyl-CoA thioester hydrolase
VPEVHTRRITVGVDSIDAHRHVNNQEYLRWMQELAIEHSTALGWPFERYVASGASWYVKSHFIDYLRPAQLGDTLLACTWVSAMNERSSPRHTLFLRESDRQIVARAETLWIYVSLKTGRPLRIADDVRAAFPLVASEAAALARLKTLD